ncbi:sensor histidine kinase [Aestuariivirga litoralis]|uniref:sensor histidine kinase n=1 Tax=Aestuariivirga litoralis TaxID=2650924 RepID=UPI0018C7F619|nr:PAS domain-containing sensor histidine kinase [Aestuariivirga litoralis]MBG1233478.1 PAS domain S-box protein [Aestuariivirga litoralis]
MTKPLQTLEDLRQSPEPAWLWDVARRRLVWANEAGIAAFNANSLFDLIDSPFDPKEPGLQVLAQLTESLPRGLTQTATLDFPSLGKTESLVCECWLYDLADGRDGMVTVARPPKKEIAVTQADLLESLPAATCGISEGGSLLFSNEMARGLFDAANTTQLSQLLVPDTQVEPLLKRLQATRLVSFISTYASPYGTREARFTLKRATEGTGVFALMTMEDVTERRQLERRMTLAPVAKLEPQEKQAFETLGRTLAAASTPEVATPYAEMPAEAPPQQDEQPVEAAPEVKATPSSKLNEASFPRALSEAFEKIPVAMAISQNGRPAYANQNLASVLGHESVSDLMQDLKFWQALALSSPEGNRATLPLADGEMRQFIISRNAMPWQNGKADQFRFEIIPENPANIPADLPVSEPEVEAIADEPELELVAPPLEAEQATAAEHDPDNIYAVDDIEAADEADELEEADTSAASEQELRSILDISSDGIITLDSAGHIIMLSAGAEAIFGYRNAELVGKPFASLLSAEGAATVKEYLAGLEGQGLASVFNDGREVTGIVKQGGSVPLFLNIGHLQSKGSTSFCAVVRDITSWKRTEQELREAKDAAEQASRHKSDFLARVSHELRTPLNAIMGFADVMRTGQFGDIGNEKYRAYLNDIHGSGSHLLSMIDDLLDFSKIESGRMELNFTAVSLVDCFDHAANLLQDQATRARVLLRKSFPDNLPRVVADQRAMRQVMLNLLSNGIKYTDAGGQIIVSAQVGAHGALILRLKDTGIGMDETELQQALQPFARVTTAGRERQGTGLGLPLTKALVEANRASFDITSEPGKGTLIEITFPTTRVLAE